MQNDYYPFGMPMPNRNIQDANAYRYAYQGQEKDPETGKEAFELRLWDGRIGSWLSPDPMRQYYSPYLGMGNNPLKFVDIDGGRIIVSYNGVRYDYRDGQLFNTTTGNLYEGNDDFLTKTRDALGKLDCATSHYTENNGNLERIGIIVGLVKSDDIYRIVYKRRVHATGAYIRIDPRATVSTPTAKGVKRSPYEIILAHELGHLVSLFGSFKNRSEWFNLEGQSKSFDENFASHYENIFREALDLPLRTHYATIDGLPYGPSALFMPRVWHVNSIPTSNPQPILISPRTFEPTVIPNR